jgi:hypothetical protein
MKKKVAESLVGFTAGDALTMATLSVSVSQPKGFCNSSTVRLNQRIYIFQSLFFYENSHTRCNMWKTNLVNLIKQHEWIKSF